MDSESLTQREMVGLLVEWLGFSLPALLFALWGVWDATWDRKAAGEFPGPARGSRIGQSRANLFMSLTLLLESFVYLGLGILIVAGPAKITLTGPLAYVVAMPPLLVITRVVVLRINRTMQKRIIAKMSRKDGPDATV